MRKDLSMKRQKLRLNLEALNVETFGVLPEAAEFARGTVEARTGFWGSACTDCALGCGAFADSVACPTDPAPTMMDWSTCGQQLSCADAWCGYTPGCPLQQLERTCECR